MKFLLVVLLSSTFLACASKSPVKSASRGHEYDKAEPIPEDTSHLLSDVQQMTFAGKRTGEGYFSADGKYLTFQSEREKDNPFYQIYLMNLESGDTQRVSPGYGKTTCSWVHPSNKKVLFASTHKDPLARKKMKEELDFRASGKTRRYSWDYDETYDLFEASSKGQILRQLTRAKGYDAEGSYSPNGQLIAFSSNRHAYSEKLTKEEQDLLSKDPSYFLDIYVMDTDGKNIKRLTTSKGYDGGPFFSPDGQRIIWRRFSPDGRTAEIHTINIDGTDERQLTHLSAMSWAPFYHPSGDYVVFTTNKHGYKNFELYIVDTMGTKEPVRVSFMDGFDGLPVFTPDGSTLTWTRRAQGISQIYKSNWSDQRARELLGLSPSAPQPNELSPQVNQYDVKRVVNYLASKALKGRASGSPEEVQYTSAFVNFFRGHGLTPGFNNEYIHKFEFASGSELGVNNRAQLIGMEQKLELGKNWTPLSFSKNGPFAPAAMVFAGYGLVTPETDEFKAYDSYQDLDVKDKWVVLFRYLPEGVSAKQRVYFNRYAKLQYKVMLARERGAAGVVIVSGPSSNAKSSLIQFQTKGDSEELSLPVISIDDSVAEALFKKAGKNLNEVQKSLDSGEMVTSFELGHTKLTASVNIVRKTATGLNVLAMLKVPGATKTLVIGAHGDHLGQGISGSSLMKSTDTDSIHYGADDNASGVAGVVELAQYLNQPPIKKSLKQNILFAIWSAEEIGVIGSNAFLVDYKAKYKKVYPQISAYLNMDMIGRYDQGLSVQSTASSPSWPSLIEQRAYSAPLKVTMTSDPYVPTDGMPFYLNGVPSLTFFTGAHKDYHTPSDTAEKLNFDKTVDIINFVGEVALEIARNSTAPAYFKVQRTLGKGGRQGFRIYLGTIPDYTNKKVKGMKLSGVVRGGPAEKAGLKSGDIIVRFGNKNIENIYDYVYSLEAAKPNVKTKITVMRDGAEQELEIVPLAKE